MSRAAEYSVKSGSYSAAENNWQQQGEMPLPRHGLGAVALNEAIYVIGGATAVGLKQTSAVLERVVIQIKKASGLAFAL